MSKLFSNYSINDINRDLADLLSEKQVNVFRLFVMKDQMPNSNEKQIGTKSSNKQNTKLDAKLSVTLAPNTNHKNDYHGLHPRFDERCLREFLQPNKQPDNHPNEKINSSEIFWKQVHKYCPENFKLISGPIYQYPEDQTRYTSLQEETELEETLMGRAILQMMTHYGFIIEAENSIKTEFINTIINKCEQMGTNENLYISTPTTTSENILHLVNIWPRELIDEAAKTYALEKLDGNRLKLIKNDITNPENDQAMAENGLNELLSYQHMKYFTFLGTTAYYSGVMPCVMAIDYKINQAANSSIKHLIFEVCRTTYATLEMMDNTGVLKHHYFTDQANPKRKELMTAFDDHEDKMQEEFLFEPDIHQANETTVHKAKSTDQRSIEEHEIKRINNYLSQSFNTHTIAVSSNVTTSDNYLIAGRRNAGIADAGEYYCSFNGQSEFVDSNVQFYKESVFEDLPSMDYCSGYRVDLNNELRREAIAELGISTFAAEWDYLGVSYLAIHNREKNVKNKPVQRRMHFNVLTQTRTPLEFKNIVLSQKHATENFENSNIIGLKLNVYSSFIDRITDTGSRLLLWLDKYKPTIFVLLILISSLLLRRSRGSFEFVDIFEIFISILYTIILTYAILKDHKLRKLMSSKTLYLPKFTEKRANKKDTKKPNAKKIIKHLSKRKILNQKPSFHGIFILMLLLGLKYDE